MCLKRTWFLFPFQPLSKPHSEYSKHLIINGCKFLDVEEEWFMFHFKLFYACILCIQCLLFYPMTHASSFVHVAQRYFIISFYVPNISQGCLFKNALKYILIAVCQRSQKGPWNQLWLIINELNGFDLSPSDWHFNRNQNRASTWFLKWPLYWGQQIADGDQTWFVEQILNAQLGLRPTIKTLLKHAILLKTSPTHSMEYWTDPVQNRLLDFGLGLRLKFGINLSNSLIFWRQLLTRPLLKIIIACWNTFKVSTFQRGSKPTFRIGILMCSDAK